MKNHVETNKSVEYKDRIYVEKRKTLRQLSTKDEIRANIDEIADSVYNFLTTTKAFNDVNKLIDIEMDLWFYIKTLLIDGYLALEIVSKDDQVLSLSALDPSTITFDGESFKQSYTEALMDESKTCITNMIKHEKFFSKDQIVYLIYSKVADSHISYVEELKESYEKMKMAESKIFYVDTPPFLNLEDLRYMEEKFKLASRINGNRSHNFYLKRLHKLFINEMFHKILK